ncbi:hypothetical protein L1787_00345 [Acuticoccus sp. M5D2P5]|uniref:hypothetical protein n=1 Tax=Acuticoccus kalidii TaxID=2910977 RepID=UPI001F29E742|nr:hypothetical protein [Acuticoccus kalidii]MCF3931859.1 hypothetical protein [Acuticoccus kalidii]
MSVSAMTMPDTLSMPAVIALVLLGLILVVWLIKGLSGGRRERANRPQGGGRARPRDTAQMIAAVQAERDVLRANHAVEIATLEGKLADAHKRVQTNLDAELKLKAAERQLADAKATIARLESERGSETSRLEALSKERDGLVERVHSVPQLMSERDRANGEIARQSEIISGLRNELQETIAKLSRATADSTNQGGAVDTLTRERDMAREEAARLVGTVGDLRRDLQIAHAKLEENDNARDAHGTLAKEHDEIKDRVEILRRTVKERDATIAELRAAMGRQEPVADTGEIDRLKGLLEAAEAREKTANDSLSRLAYDRDGLQNRLAGLERAESGSKAEIEKREALLELRLQKIYELEARLRDQHTQLREAQRRAEMAEESVTALASAGATEDSAEGLSPEAQAALVQVTSAANDARIERLQTKLDQVRNENGTLLDELEALRVAATADAASSEGGDVDTMRAGLTAELQTAREAMAALEAENARLKAAVDAGNAFGQDEIAELKAKLRDLATRFMNEAAPDVEEEPAEPTLADRIRAFKAARAATTANGGA